MAGFVPIRFRILSLAQPGGHNSSVGGGQSILEVRIDGIGNAVVLATLRFPANIP